MQTEETRHPVPSRRFLLLLLGLGGLVGAILIALDAPLWVFYVAPILTAPLLVHELRVLDADEVHGPSKGGVAAPEGQSWSAKLRSSKGEGKWTRETVVPFRLESASSLGLQIAIGLLLATAIAICFLALGAPELGWALVLVLAALSAYVLWHRIKSQLFDAEAYHEASLGVLSTMAGVLLDEEDFSVAIIETGLGWFLLEETEKHPVYVDTEEKARELASRIVQEHGGEMLVLRESDEEDSDDDIHGD